jgi:hypothetical protein
MQEAKLSLIGQNRMQDLNGGPFGSFRNKTIGGDFGTNPWQRGTSFVTVASGAYTADRWLLVNTSAVIVNVVQDSAVPTVAQAGRLVTLGLAIVVTTADTTVAAGDVVYLQQAIEGYNFQALAQKPMVFSFLHAHSKPGIYCVAFRSSNGDRSFVAEYTQNVSAAYEYTSIVIPPSPAAGTWNYTNGTGLVVDFTLMSGTTFQTTPGIWQTGNFLATANQVNMMDAANIFRLSLVQLESGTVATPFESRSIQEELALSQRYYQKSFRQATAPAAAVGVNTGEFQTMTSGGPATGNYWSIVLQTSMRTKPTVTLYNPVNANGQINAFGVGDFTSSVAGNNGSETGFTLLGTSPATAPAGSLSLVHWTANAEL